jgi:pimeloyl-ACP methyl ester carboxylesterase
MSISENYLQVGDLKWFYRQNKPTGDQNKSPVVLLHGVPAQSYSWSGIMTILAEHNFSALAPDWIGFGFSDKPPAYLFKYTPDAYIQALDEFLTKLEVNHFSLVVQGFLGSVGIQFALRYPEKIDRLIIVNAPLTEQAKLPATMKQWAIPLVGDMLTQDPILVDRTLEGGSGFVIEDKKLDVYRKPFLTSSGAGRALVSVAKNMKLKQSMAEISTGLPKFSQPTLIIWGKLDPWLDISQAENFAKGSKIELEILPEAKHYPQEHWVQEMGEIMVNFLRRQIF